MLSLITDRSQGDVDTLLGIKEKINSIGWAALTDNEKASWMSTKGEYRYSDLNRVGSAVLYLSGILNGYGYYVTVNPKTDWTVNDKPSPGQRSSYISDIQAIKNRFYGTTVLPISLDNIRYTDANKIELALQEVELLLVGAVDTFKYAGTFEAGEV